MFSYENIIDLYIFYAYIVLNYVSRFPVSRPLAYKTSPVCITLVYSSGMGLMQFVGDLNSFEVRLAWWICAQYVAFCTLEDPHLFSPGSLRPLKTMHVVFQNRIYIM